MTAFQFNAFDASSFQQVSPMNPPAKDIADYLETVGLGIVGTSIFAYGEPASPDDTITIYDTGGYDPIIPALLYSPTVQVRTRSMNYDTAWGKLLEVQNELLLPTTREIGGSRYIGIWMTGDANSLGRDDNNRWRIVANFRIQRQPGG